MPNFVTDPQQRLYWFAAIVFLAYAVYSPFDPGFVIWFYRFFPEDDARRSRYLLYQQIAASVMASMGLTELAHLPMGELSGGMRQKVYIAMALAQQTPVILMDEPTTYLDIAQQRAFGEMMQQLASQGKALLLVLHDLLLALRISHKIVVLSGGRVRFCGTPQELMASPVLEEVYGVEIKSVQTQRGERLFYDF
jgi:iron complex transport system ATP-binding protein